MEEYRLWVAVVDMKNQLVLVLVTAHHGIIILTLSGTTLQVCLGLSYQCSEDQLVLMLHYPAAATLLNNCY